MHLSRQLAAFIRAGLPILEAVHTIGAEADNSSLRRMMAESKTGCAAATVSRTASTGTRRSSPSSTAASCARPSSPAAGHRPGTAGDLPGARPRGAAQGQVRDDLPGHRQRDVGRHRCRAGRRSCCPRFKTFFEGLNAKLPLPTRMLLACTDFLIDLVVGDRSAASAAVGLGISRRLAHRPAAG